MDILQEAINEMAFAKVGFLGFQSGGKTLTSVAMAIGLAKAINTKEIAFVDTETGSDWVKPIFDENNIKLFVSKSRAFSDLLSVGQECLDNNILILITDSITHIWRDLCDSYKKKWGRTKLQFQDWGIIKTEWSLWSDFFINSAIHIFVCGRAGFEYDYDYDVEGNKDLIKVGTKMKAETEFGFEPSLVIEMERSTKDKEELEKLKKEVTRDDYKSRQRKQEFKPEIGSEVLRFAHVLKDRSRKLDGAVFCYKNDSPLEKVFADFKPHFDCINLGGEHRALDIDRTSEDRFKISGKPDWKIEKENREIVLEKITGELVLTFPNSVGAERVAKLRTLDLAFKTKSWKEVEKLQYQQLELGLKKIQVIINTDGNVEKLLEKEYKKEDIVIPDILEEDIRPEDIQISTDGPIEQPENDWDINFTQIQKLKKEMPDADYRCILSETIKSKGKFVGYKHSNEIKTLENQRKIIKSLQEQVLKIKKETEG